MDDALTTHTDENLERLTIEVVLERYDRLIRSKLVKFTNGDDLEDCFQQVVLAMITPSKTLGTSFLERYNPSRGNIPNYLSMFCVQQMSKRFNRMKSSPETVPILQGTSEDIERLTGLGVSEEAIQDLSETKLDIDTIKSPEDLRRILQGTHHIRVTSCSPSGEPRSTYHMLCLIVWEGLTPKEVADRLGVTSSEVYRRLKALRTEPRLVALRGDNTPP